MKAQAIVEPAGPVRASWRIGVRNSVGALLEFLASEPYLTRLAFVDAPLAGPTMAKRMHEQAGAYPRLMLDGAPSASNAGHRPEAAVQGLIELAFHESSSHTKQRDRGALPRERHRPRARTVRRHQRRNQLGWV